MPKRKHASRPALPQLSGSLALLALGLALGWLVAQATLSTSLTRTVSPAPLVLVTTSAANATPSPLPVYARNVQEFRVVGPSMAPTLPNGWRVLVDFDYYAAQPLRRGDVVIYQFKTRPELLVKRVIALPGDRVEFDLNNTRILLNGQPLAEPYLASGTPQFASSGVSLLRLQLSRSNNTIPAKSVLALGDARAHSLDSGYYGWVPAEYIQGRVLLDTLRPPESSPPAGAAVVESPTVEPPQASPHLIILPR